MTEAEIKGKDLLREILPDPLWTEFEQKNVISVRGKKGLYKISARAQTAFLGRSTEHNAYLCMRLGDDCAPTFDRMAAEYLLIKNAEDVYWNHVNVFFFSGEQVFSIIEVLLVVLDAALFVNLLLEILGL